MYIPGVLVRFLATLLLAVAPASWAADPVVYLGVSSQAVEMSVANSGEYFAEISGGEVPDSDASYAAFRMGARTTGKNLFEFSAGLATLEDCATGLGETFVPSVSLGTGYVEGPLRVVFNMRYIEHGAASRCAGSGAMDGGSEIIGVAGVGYQF